MTDEATICTAAFFRNIGKDVSTPEELVMVTSLELKWMSPSDSKLLLKRLLELGTITKKGEFVRPSKDLSAVDLPLSYRPSAEFVASLREAPKAPAKAAPSKDGDVLRVLTGVAKDHGIEQRAFIPECGRLSKELDIDITVAALIVLRENGIDVSEHIGNVYSALL